MCLGNEHRSTSKNGRPFPVRILQRRHFSRPEAFDSVVDIEEGKSRDLPWRLATFQRLQGCSHHHHDRVRVDCFPSAAVQNDPAPERNGSRRPHPESVVRPALTRVLVSSRPRCHHKCFLRGVGRAINGRKIGGLRKPPVPIHSAH